MWVGKSDEVVRVGMRQDFLDFLCLDKKVPVQIGRGASHCETNYAGTRFRVSGGIADVLKFFFTTGLNVLQVIKIANFKRVTNRIILLIYFLMLFLLFLRILFPLIIKQSCIY